MLGGHLRRALYDDTAILDFVSEFSRIAQITDDPSQLVAMLIARRQRVPPTWG